MSAKNHASFYIWFILIISIGNAVAQKAPSVGSTLPKIDQDFYQLTPTENGYTLRIILQDGDQRDETVELKNPGTPQEYLAVMGSSYTHYYPGISATVTYTADKNGYVVKYKYEMRPTNVQSSIGVGALKASAG